jgi:hypothetical protein
MMKVESKTGYLQRLSLLLPLLLILIRDLLIMYAELIERYTDGLLIVMKRDLGKLLPGRQCYHIRSKPEVKYKFASVDKAVVTSK